MAAIHSDDKLKRALIAGVVTFVVLELVFLAVEIPPVISGYQHPFALLFSLFVFLGVLTS